MGSLFEGWKTGSAGHLTNRAARLFAWAIDLKFKPLGVSAGQIPVFFALGAGESLTQKELVEVAAVEQPTMAAILTRMERDGLVERRPDPKDGRSSLVQLTPKAMKKVPDMVEAIQTGNREALAGFSEAEKAAFLDMLRRIIANLQAMG